MSFRPLRADEIEVRIGQVKKDGTGFSLLLYKTSRTDMALLDETVGAMNWKCRYEVVRDSMFCYISIYDSDKKEWIEKGNAGDKADMEVIKSEASDALKRAGTVWGIGRELYNAPFIWIKGTPNKFGNAYRVTNIEYDNGEISYLTIVSTTDRKEIYRYGYPKGEKRHEIEPKQEARQEPPQEPPKPQEPKQEPLPQAEEEPPIECYDVPKDLWGNNITPEEYKDDSGEVFATQIANERKIKKIREASKANKDLNEWVIHRLMVIGKAGTKLEQIGDLNIDYIYKEVIRRGL